MDQEITGRTLETMNAERDEQGRTERDARQLYLAARINGRDTIKPLGSEQQALLEAESLFNQFGDSVESVYLLAGTLYVTQYFSRRDVL
jgi:hypothetical protein